MSERTVTLHLGGREFTVPRLKLGAELRWREQVGPLAERLTEALSLMRMDISSPDDIARAVSSAAAITDVEAALDALFAYAPELAGLADWIAENAYADEVVNAVVSLFFGGTLQRGAASRPQNGAAAQPSKMTSQS